MTQRKPLDPVKIVNMLNAGFTHEEVAAKLKVSRWHLVREMKKNKVVAKYHIEEH